MGLTARWRRKLDGEAIQAGEYDTEVILAFLFHWDYWQVQTLPNDYIAELFARKLAEMEMKAEAKEQAKRELKEADTIAKLRAGNAASLRALGLGKD